MGRNHYAPPTSRNQNGEPTRRSVLVKHVLLISAAAIILPFALFVAREVWRDHTLLAFCKAAHAGMRFADLLALEKRHWIDDSYLVQARFHGYVDQLHSQDLEFRSHMLDPDFACAIGHDGETVKSVQLLTLEGFDPN